MSKENTVIASFWVVVSEDGNVECAEDSGDAQTRFGENIGGNEMRRMICVELAVPFPVVTAKGVVPNEGEAKLTAVRSKETITVDAAAVTAALARCQAAIDGDSNDEEHEALLALMEATSPSPEPADGE